MLSNSRYARTQPVCTTDAGGQSEQLKAKHRLICGNEGRLFSRDPVNLPDGAIHKFLKPKLMRINERGVP